MAILTVTAIITEEANYFKDFRVEKCKYMKDICAAQLANKVDSKLNFAKGKEN